MKQKLKYLLPGKATRVSVSYQVEAEEELGVWFWWLSCGTVTSFA